MTEKELRKLRRQDLLQLLLLQSRDVQEISDKLVDRQVQLSSLVETVSRLKVRLNEKDAEIDRLKKRLDEREARLDALTDRLQEKDDAIARLIRRLDGETDPQEGSREGGKP